MKYHHLQYVSVSVAVPPGMALRLHTQVKDILQKMEKCYDNLAQHLSQATVAPETVDESLVHPNTGASSKQLYKWFFLGLGPLKSFFAIWGHPVRRSNLNLCNAQSWTCPWVHWCSVQSHLASKRYFMLTRSLQAIFISLNRIDVLSVWPTSQRVTSLRSIKIGGPGSSVGSDRGTKPKPAKSNKGDPAAKGKSKARKARKSQTA